MGNKKCLYMPALNSCLGLWELLGAPRRRVLWDSISTGDADSLSPDAELNSRNLHPNSLKFCFEESRAV